MKSPGNPGLKRNAKSNSRLGALDLASLHARRAHADLDGGAISGIGANSLKVRQETALITDVGMGYAETGLRTLATHCATSCHDGLLLLTLRLKPYVCCIQAELEHTTSAF